ncbi:FtsB family cell division protein [Scatolibacter rhodanostii]|uniref:FtsB family cell division protein n=1 Tax=Scatolibacter rhodanostii TaxID=2014781 RepID=UPI000C08681F|nr:septum formation initiator family protein [Scatolibacter rhodanostii]
MKEVKIKKSSGSLLLKISILCMAGFFAFLITTQQFQIAEKKNHLGKIREDMQTQLVKNEELQHSLDNEQDMKEYAERTARNDYNYAKPDERVYINIGGVE